MVIFWNLKKILKKELKLKQSYCLKKKLKKFNVNEGFIVTSNKAEEFEIEGLKIHILKEKEFRKKFGMNSE